MYRQKQDVLRKLIDVVQICLSFWWLDFCNKKKYISNDRINKFLSESEHIY